MIENDPEFAAYEKDFRAKWKFCVAPLAIFLFFCFISWLIFKLPFPFDWIVFVCWSVFMAGQWYGYYIEGDGFKQDDHYIETGEILD